MTFDIVLEDWIFEKIVNRQMDRISDSMEPKSASGFANILSKILRLFSNALTGVESGAIA